MTNTKTSAAKKKRTREAAKKKQAREREAAQKKRAREREATKKRRAQEAAKKKRASEREAAKKKRAQEAAKKKRAQEAAKKKRARGTARAPARRPRQPKRAAPSALDAAPPPSHRSTERPPTTPGRAWTTLEIVRDGIRRAGEASGYGGGKTLVSSVYDKVRAQIDMTLPQFKRWLVRANQQGDLILARADIRTLSSPDHLRSDPNVLRDSEIEDMGSTFHFVMDQPERPEDLREEAKQMIAVQRAEDRLSR